MKQKVLLVLLAASTITAAQAQKNSEKLTTYAITAAEKGSSRWTEVKLVDVLSGEVIQSIYESKSDPQLLNARTKKPIVKKEITEDSKATRKVIILQPGEKLDEKLLSTLKHETIIVQERKKEVNSLSTTAGSPAPERITEKRVFIRTSNRINSDAPLASNAAACAYDKKHDRLYYTPMGVNQLRYIDLKSNTPVIYYFEDEPLGALSSPHDVPNQVTRMAIGSDGDGYALTNNAEHLIRFGTNKKAKITDLGALTDDPSNGNYSIHNRIGYGGDMVADDKKNLYVITGNRVVFYVDVKTMVAKYVGTIKGLPKGFTTNGAAVEKGSSIIVTSSTYTSGYYKFDLNTMQAEKVSTAGSVYNASDLANANFIAQKKVKKADEEKVVEEKPIEKEEAVAEAKTLPIENANSQKISVYPNPAITETVKISFDGYEPGIYQLQLMDLAGKVLSTQTLNINNKLQVREYRLPSQLAKGTYILNVINNASKLMNTEKIIVQ